ncbi:MAG: nucleotidyltransferase domain-containing protein [Puniceicoccales bacterium]|jgi:predicted nucleotidyltransferase|nr:nucleotidyltransferase domain-containing protein [Puniceicoccales bacterium]
MNFHLEERYLNIVKTILQAHFGNDAPAVYLFGSRATGNRIKKYSDIDLAIEFKNKDSLASKLLLETAFEESLLPYRVDIVDYNSCSADFREIIDQTKIKLNL